MQVIRQTCKQCPGCGHFVEKTGGCYVCHLRTGLWPDRGWFAVRRLQPDEVYRLRDHVLLDLWQDHRRFHVPHAFPGASSVCSRLLRYCFTHSNSSFLLKQWWNLGGCAGSQMTNVEAETKCSRFVSNFFRVLFLVIFGPPAFVLAAAFSVLFCCYAPCIKFGNVSFRQAFSTCFCMSGYLLLSPLILAAGLIVSPCLCVACCTQPDLFSVGDSDEAPPSQRDLPIPVTEDIDRIQVAEDIDRVLV